MDAPVAMKHNLHNAVMRPRTGDFWFAYAAKNGSSAWDQPYVHLNLLEILKRDRPQVALEKGTDGR
jgi:hypothetical protein